MVTLTRAETVYLVFVVAVMAAGAVVWVWAAGIGSDSHTITRQVIEQPTWPQVTRTIDGSPTVVQPEDLDR
jgi:hypothetical protein